MASTELARSRGRQLALTAVAAVAVIGLGIYVWIDKASPGPTAPVSASMPGKNPSPTDSAPTATGPKARTQVAEILPEDLGTFPDLNLAMQSSSVWHAPQRAHQERLRRIPVLYEDLGREPALASKANEVVDLFLRHEVEKWTLQDHVDSTDDEGFAAAFRGLLERHREELVDLVGQAGITALERYERSHEIRFEVEELRDWLDGTDRPLTEIQRRAVLDAVLRPGQFIQRRRFSDSESPQAIRQEVAARVEQNDRQLLASARAILDGEQWARYAAELEARRPDAIAAETPEFARAPPPDASTSAKSVP